MNAFLHRSGALVTAALLLWVPLARAQLGRVEALGFKHAFVDQNTGKRTMLLSGGSVTNISSEELLIGAGVRLQFFDDAGKTNLEVATPGCLYNVKTDVVASTNRLEAAGGNGQLSIEGDGFEYTRANGALTISNHVHAVIGKQLLAAQSPTPAAPGAVAPASPAAPARATNEFLHIYSDHLRYVTNVVVFDDDVRVEDPQGQLTCGRLTVTFTAPSEPEEKRQIENIVAEQRVVIDSGEVHATGEQATYRQAADVVELTGHPLWRLRQYEGRAEELVLYRQTRAFRARRNTELTLPPGSIGPGGFLLPESAPATNASPTPAQPTRVRADDFEFKPDVADTNFNLGVFRGNVRVTAPKGNLSCELMTIRSTASSNRTDRVVAERSVVLEQRDKRVTGERAVYTAATDTVEITGQPAWKMGEREGTSEVLSFNLKDNAYRATRGVTMRLPPGAFGRTPWLLPESKAKTNTPAVTNATATHPPARPIEISSDEFEFLPAPPGAKADTAIYRGNVLVSDAERMKLSCDLLSARILSGTNQVENVIAERRVDLDIHDANGARRARGDKAVYTAADETVVLTGGEGVEIAFVDSKIEGQARGTQAVYAGGKDVLELRGNPVLTTQYGRVWGEVLVLNRANTTLQATGNWKMKLNPDALKKQTPPPPPKS